MNISNFKSMDVNMLFSIINMKLRDEIDSLDELCRYYDVEKREIEEKLKESGYEYIKEQNRFR